MYSYCILNDVFQLVLYELHMYITKFYLSSFASCVDFVGFIVIPIFHLLLSRLDEPINTGW